MIQSQLQRLLRPLQSGHLEEFVQELYALLNATAPQNKSGPLTLTQTGSIPALTIVNQSGDGNRVLMLQDGQGNDLGGITIGGVAKQGGPGGITVGATDQGPISVGRDTLAGVQYTTTPPPTTAGSSSSGPLVIDFSAGNSKGKAVTTLNPASGSTGGGSGFPCQVQSGTGDTYTCKVYRNGKSDSAPITATVKQLQIDAAATIPANSWAIASLGTDGTYTMQFPVWL